MVITILIRWAKFTLFIGIMILMFVSMINSSSNIMKLDFEEMKIQKIAKYVPGIWGIMKEDSSREAAVARTMNIINKYNRKLDENVKLEIANEIYLMSIKYSNLDIDLICATITHESALTWEQDVISPAGAMGLMQIMPNTGYFLSKLEGIPWTNAEDVLYDPIKNIRMGCRYLSALIEMYHLDGGLAAYNGGAKRAAKWLASGRDDEVLLEETRGYVPAVLNLYKNFRN